MTKKLGFLAVALSVITTTAIVAGVTMASTNGFGLGKGNNPEREQTRQAIETGDYNTWATQMQQRVANMRQNADDLEAKINNETFVKYQTAHQLMQSGDRAGAQTIFEEIGMGGMGGFGIGGRGKHMGAQCPLNSQVQPTPTQTN